jgi:cell division protein DivIC
LNLRRLILSLYLALFVAVSVTAWVYFADTREEYARLKAVEAGNRRRLDEAEKRLRDDQKVLERLRSDPEFVERKIRERLGYTKEDEKLFRFEN